MQNRLVTECRHKPKSGNDNSFKSNLNSQNEVSLAFEGYFPWSFRLEDMLDRIEGHS